MAAVDISRRVHQCRARACEGLLSPHGAPLALTHLTHITLSMQALGHFTSLLPLPLSY